MLSAAGTAGEMQRGQRADDREERCGQVGYGQADAHRRFVGHPGREHRSAQGLDDAVHRLDTAAVGTLLARPETADRAVDEPGVDLADGVVVEARSRLIVPLLKFWTSRSACRHRSRKTSRPSSVLRFTVTLSLLRILESTPMERSSSWTREIVTPSLGDIRCVVARGVPPGGDSTLMTRAPRPARIMVA